LDLTGFDTLFLDRDGVINRLLPNNYVKCWDEFQFLPGILDALAKWNREFKYIFIVTNQRGVGKRVMSENNLWIIHSKMVSEIKVHGGRIDKIYYCTALTEEDMNRKPNPGMAIQAKKDYPEIDFTKSVMIGDSESDTKFAENAGMKGIKVSV
jgi:histidinol-phosphate phosphatase family protein